MHWIRNVNKGNKQFAEKTPMRLNCIAGFGEAQQTDCAAKLKIFSRNSC